jgi:hypothetical protein
MMKNKFCLFLIALAVFALPDFVIAENPETEQSTDDLQLIKKTLHGELRLNTGADWSRFTQIQLERATVEFREHWARDQKNRGGNRPTEENMERIRVDLSELLDEVFRQELTADNIFTMSDTSGENVIRITPKILNLNIYAPDRMRDYIGYSMADSKGNMTLELKVYNSVSGALLAHMVDSREDPGKGYLEWTTSGTNRRAARFMFIRWADKLHDWLVDAGSPAQD